MKRGLLLLVCGSVLHLKNLLLLSSLHELVLCLFQMTFPCDANSLSLAPVACYECWDWSRSGACLSLSGSLPDETHLCSVCAPPDCAASPRAFFCAVHAVHTAVERWPFREVGGVRAGEISWSSPHRRQSLSGRLLAENRCVKSSKHLFAFSRGRSSGL